MSSTSTTKYPLLQEILALKGQNLQPTYTIRDVAVLFTVTPRAIQNRVSSGQLQARDLPGRAKFFSEDLEAFLAASLKKGRSRGK